MRVNENPRITKVQKPLDLPSIPALLGASFIEIESFETESEEDKSFLFSWESIPFSNFGTSEALEKLSWVHLQYCNDIRQYGKGLLYFIQNIRV